MKNSTLLLSTLVLLCANSFALPTLFIDEAGSSTATTGNYTIGSSTTLTLDILLDTSSLAITGIQFDLNTVGNTVVTYSATPLTITSTPFVPADLQAPSPSGGNPISSTTPDIGLFKTSAGDYPAFAKQVIAKFSIDTSSLALGTYVFTPLAVEFVNADSDFVLPTDFGVPGSYTLTVVPEPSTYAMLAIGSLVAGGAILRRKLARI